MGRAHLGATDGQTRREKRRSRRIASGPQLYVLNRAGLLGFRRRPSDAITAAEADEAIKESMSRYGGSGVVSSRSPSPR
jgi:hypothetical protein